MKNTKEIRKSIVVLVVICLLTSAALAVVNHFTAPRLQGERRGQSRAGAA